MDNGMDKSIPFQRVVMRMEPDLVSSLPEPELPDGYTFRTYEPGDMKTWAGLETSVDEFPDTDAAESYFSKTFLPFEEKLSERMFFICDPDGRAVSTGTAWEYESHGETMPLVHWICVSPEAQGKKLGSAVVQRVLKCFQQIEPGKPVYLETQTWSHRAIRMYLRLGFRAMTEEHVFLREKNDFTAACEVLRTVFDQNTMNQFGRNNDLPS